MGIKKYKSNFLVCGCDESGRGALAGPVVAAAVILNKDFETKDINDSKKLSAVKRSELFKKITSAENLWGIGIVENNEIDKLNILNSSILAMHKAIAVLEKKINNFKNFELIIDGNKFKQYKKVKHSCIISGDSKFFSIAAASILAKFYRDNIMINLDKKLPQYNWKCNKGYPTRQHRKTIINFGVSKFHRKSFKMNNQLNLWV
jgi:ribonuclease HII